MRETATRPIFPNADAYDCEYCDGGGITESSWPWSTTSGNCKECNGRGYHNPPTKEEKDNSARLEAAWKESRERRAN